MILKNLGRQRHQTFRDSDNTEIPNITEDRKYQKKPEISMIRKIIGHEAFQISENTEIPNPKIPEIRKFQDTEYLGTSKISGPPKNTGISYIIRTRIS